MTTRVRGLIAAGLLALMAGLMFGSYRHDSPTRDEPLHFIRGLAYWWTGDARLSYAHPPLANALSALPVALTAERVDIGSWPEWQAAQVEPTFQRYLAEVGFERAQREVYLARLPGIVLALLFGVYFLAWTKRFFGPDVALLALSFYCLSATIMANARLVTTDFAVLVTGATAVMEWTRYLVNSRWSTLLLAAACGGLVMATKHNGVLILAFLGVLSCGFAWRRLGVFARARTWKSALGLLAVQAGVLAGSAVLIVNAAYRFQESGLTAKAILEHEEPQNWITSSYDGKLMERRSPIKYLPAALPIPIPFTYLYGLSSIAAHNKRGHSSYFMGSPTRGSPAYFPVLLLVKNQSVIALVMLMSLVWIARRRIRPFVGTSLPTRALFLFTLFYVGIAMLGKLNIGIRHVIVVLPGLFVLCAAFVVHQWHALSAFMRVAIVALYVESVAHMALAYPHHQGYFNLFGGGHRYGPFISVVTEDWGQDIKATAEYFQARGVTSAYSDLYGWMAKEEFAAAGVQTTKLDCGTVVPRETWVSLHRTTEFRKDKDKCYPWMETARVEALINDHVTVYYVP